GQASSARPIHQPACPPAPCGKTPILTTAGPWSLSHSVIAASGLRSPLRKVRLRPTSVARFTGTVGTRASTSSRTSYPHEPDAKEASVMANDSQHRPASFYASPEEAKQATPEELLYVACLDQGTDLKQPDFIAVVDADPGSDACGQIIH